MTGPAARVRVFMAMEPETSRVLMQDRPVGPADVPPGIEGEGWTLREGEVDQGAWEAQLADQLTSEDSDAFHRDAWTKAGPTPWPSP